MTERILVANRGEIAVRILRTAAELNIPTVALHSADDHNSLHLRMADQIQPLKGVGINAYLDIEQIIHVAMEQHCSMIHPGYGFLSENSQFAESCEANGINFIGPSSQSLELFGNKTKSRELANQCQVKLLPGTAGPTSLSGVKSFFDSLDDGEAIMIKALFGGGGRGMRPVYELAELEEAFRLCQSEALAAFGKGELYVEKLIRKARHIEVQVIGDQYGNVSHLWERECSLQRNHQKVVEVAPAPTLTQELKTQLTEAAMGIAKSAGFQSLGTFEFLVDDTKVNENVFYFLEVNPRIQVEHTVTEEITGIDLVRAQIEIATGKTLQEIGLNQTGIPSPSGYAIQCRINMEEMKSDGTVLPSGGMLETFDLPLGPGIRIDTFGYSGYRSNPNFDSLLAKLVIHSRTGNYADAVSKMYRALSELRIEGISTNLMLLQNLMSHPQVIANRIDSNFIASHLEELINDGQHPQLYFEQIQSPNKKDASLISTSEFQHQGPENTEAVNAIMPGTVVEIEVSEGDTVHKGQSLVVIEAMKMQHLIKASISGVIRLIVISRGETLFDKQPILFIEPIDVKESEIRVEEDDDPDKIRPDLQEVISRHRSGLDESRPKAVEKRLKSCQRTARENIAHLIDPDSFIEYGAMAVAAQRSRLSLDQLLEKSPADGLIAGMASINSELFDEDISRCMILAYDFTAMAGTQGAFNHKKTDRMLNLAEEWKVPLVLFAEGGGGRPGDVDAQLMHVAGLDYSTFTKYAKLSGLVPLVGIVSGRCFAGNAALLGCSDVIIATKDANIGMGGPAMIEGGGLGVCQPEDIGPIEVQSPNGVVDIVAEDEAEAVELTQKYLSYFQGTTENWECVDQRLLRKTIPENRKRAYDVRIIIKNLADTGSVLELREQFGIGIVTAFIRIEGHPFGLTANNSMHLGGAIDSDAADKASRFMQLCDAFNIPLITLSDTPGFMVGPEAEKSAQVRHLSRMFVIGASITIPVFSIILRKGYGLGAMAMVGGGYHRPVFNISWPTGEFGGMGLEGAVRLGFKKELEAEKDPEAREKLFESMVAMAYEHGKATNMASFLEIDDVIDPKDTRYWIIRGLKSVPKIERPLGKKRPNIDVW